MNSASSPNLLERFLHSQSAGSSVLLLAAVTAIVWANSPWSDLYQSMCHLDVGVHIVVKQYTLPLAHWVKDGLMALFFFVIGLEIKREILVGELSTVRKALLPVMAAIGGAVFPALIYFSLNPSGPAANGWSIPMATDIAFALGVLALFGKRVPIGLKVFLTALAIVDDLMAVVVIAIFYTAQINWLSLAAAGVLLLVLATLIRWGVRRPGVHLLVALAIWVFVLQSGVHATIAGVLIAMAYPVKATISPERFFSVIRKRMAALESSDLTRDSMLHNKRQLQAINEIYLVSQDMLPDGIALEENLHSIQAFFVLPLFALFSAGVTVSPAIFQQFPSSVSAGIICGLLLGKQIGIFGFSYLVIRSRLAELSEGIDWGQLWGVSLLSGIGFTMSIFITELAFTDQTMIADAKIAIFIVSVLAAGSGYYVLDRTLPLAREEEPEARQA